MHSSISIFILDINIHARFQDEGGALSMTVAHSVEQGTVAVFILRAEHLRLRLRFAIELFFITDSSEVSMVVPLRRTYRIKLLNSQCVSPHRLFDTFNELV